MLASQRLPSKPWYREPWPWILMAGPAIVVVAGAVTVWLALSSDDGLVAEDYYKRGLAVNTVIGRVEAGARSGMTATVQVRDGVALVQVDRLAGDPPALTLSFRHPTRAGFDHVVQARRTGPGSYRAEVGEIAAGRWLIALESPEWKLRAESRIGGGPVSLRP